MRFVCRRGAVQLLVWKQKLSRLSENVTQPYDRSRQISARRSEMLASVNTFTVVGRSGSWAQAAVLLQAVMPSSHAACLQAVMPLSSDAFKQ